MIKFVRFEEDVPVKELQARAEKHTANTPVAEGEAAATAGMKVIKKYKLVNLVKIEVPDNMKVTAATLDAVFGPTKCTEILDDFDVHHCLDNAIPVTQTNLVWNRPNLGEGMVVGISDTGVDKNHPDLQGKILGTADFTGEGDFDGHGHGTHVSTIAVGNGNQSGGKYKGAAPEAKMYMAKGLASNGSGSAASIADGIDWLADQGVDVISLSLGGPAQAGVKDILQLMCEAAVDAGIAVFVAAGNSGPSQGTIGTPGVSLKVITIGASDDNDNVADFSSRGPTVDGFEKPDIVAPGVKIIAGRAKDTSMGTVVDDFYTEASGTSMATPLAAGIGLLIKKEFNALTPVQLKARLEGHAKDLGNQDIVEGEGRVQALNSITGAQPAPEPDDPIVTPRPKPCVFTRVFGAGSTLIPVLRVLRNDFLAPTLIGRILIKLYYKL